MRPVGVFAVLMLTFPLLAHAGTETPATPPLTQSATKIVDELFEANKPEESPAAPPATEDGDFATARALLEQGGIASASAAFDEFLEKYPRSTNSAEALYRLQMARLLEQDTVKAIEARKKLLDRHPDSPWSRLVLRLHLSESDLRDYALHLRDKAQRDRRREDAVRAVEVLRLFRERFPRSSVVETVYLIAACEEIAGGDTAAREVYQAIDRAAPKESAWKSLAALRLGDAAAFAAELAKFTLDEKESAYLLLDLLDRHESELDGAALARGLYLRGRALLALKRKPEGREALARFVEEHGGAEEAPDAQFRLAESLYADGKLDEAARHYRRFARDYPAEIHAKRLRRWAAWLKHEKQDWDDLKRTLTVVAGQLREADNVFALTVKGGPIDKEAMRLRLAFEGRKRFLMEIVAGEFGFVASSNEQGACTYNRQDREATRSRQPLSVPMPGLSMTKDPATGEYNQLQVWANEEGTPGEPPLNVPEAVAEHLVRWLRSGFHLHRRERAGKGITYRLESGGASSLVITLKVDAERKFRALSVDHEAESGERSRWLVEGMQLGGKLADERFDFELPQGTKVRRVEKLSSIAWWVQVMTLMDRLSEETGPAGRALLGAAYGAMGR